MSSCTFQGEPAKLVRYREVFSIPRKLDTADSTIGPPLRKKAIPDEEAEPGRGPAI